MSIGGIAAQSRGVGITRVRGPLRVPRLAGGPPGRCVAPVLAVAYKSGSGQSWARLTVLKVNIMRNIG